MRKREYGSHNGQYSAALFQQRMHVGACQRLVGVIHIARTKHAVGIDGKVELNADGIQNHWEQAEAEDAADEPGWHLQPRPVGQRRCGEPGSNRRTISRNCCSCRIHFRLASAWRTYSFFIGTRTSNLSHEIRARNPGRALIFSPSVFPGRLTQRPRKTGLAG